MLMLTRDSLPITSSPADSDHSCHTLFSRSVELSSYSVDDAIRGHRIKGRRSSVSASASGRMTSSGPQLFVAFTFVTRHVDLTYLAHLRRKHDFPSLLHLSSEYRAKFIPLATHSLSQRRH